MKLYKVEIENDDGSITTVYEYAFDQVDAIRDAISREKGISLRVKKVKAANRADLLDAAVVTRKGA